VNVRDQAAEANAFINNYQIPYPNMLDTNGDMVSLLSGVLPPQATPSTVVLDTEGRAAARVVGERSEEHTSELQSRFDLVCRLLLRPTPPPTLLPYTTLFRSVNVRDQAAEANAFINNYQIPYPNMLDTNGDMVSLLSGVLPPQATPSTVVLDTEGRAAARVVGE